MQGSILDVEQPSDLRAQADRLVLARKNSAALGDQGWIVVLPSRSLFVKQACPLTIAHRRLRVEEDVAVVERRDQLDLFREQHAVAEHVTAHIADADYRERILLRVHPQFMEMPFDRFPGPARRDRHPLVVITR